MGLRRRKMMALALVGLLLLSGALGVVWLLAKPDVDRYERTDYSFRVVVSVRNLGQSPATNVPLRLGLPRDDPPAQTVVSVDFSEPPIRMSNDTFGNEFAHFELDILEPRSTWNVTMSVRVTLHSIDFNVEPEGLGEYPGEGERFLEPDFYVNYNEPNVLDLAQRLAESSSDVWDLAWRTYDWVLKNIYYQQVPGEIDASTTLKNGEGGSAEIANLYVALMRANGVPARRASGWGHHFEEGDELQISRFSHGWAEVYAPGYGWVPVDPTWGQSNRYDNFAKSDDAHVLMTWEAGVHYMQRGDYNEPFGPTDVRTDYLLMVLDKRVENLSSKRDVIAVLVLAPPVVFIAFIAYKRTQLRKVA